MQLTLPHLDTPSAVQRWKEKWREGPGLTLGGSEQDPLNLIYDSRCYHPRQTAVGWVS